MLSCRAVDVVMVVVVVVVWWGRMSLVLLSAPPPPQLAHCIRTYHFALLQCLPDLRPVALALLWVGWMGQAGRRRSVCRLKRKRGVSDHHSQKTTHTRTRIQRLTASSL